MHILSFVRHAIHARGPVDQQQDSNLFSTIREDRNGMSGEHTRVEQYETICANQVDTTSSSLTTEQKDELFSIRIIELVDEFLTFVDCHTTVQSEVAVSVVNVSPRTTCEQDEDGLTSYYGVISRINRGSVYSY